MNEDDIFFGTNKPKKDDNKDDEYYDPPSGPIFNIHIGGCLPATVLIIIVLVLGYLVLKGYGYKVIEPEVIKKELMEKAK